ncbi:FkbM family methyltransferase [Halorubrum sp. N11]|uniref:FkbM family methyltransferase n=1 Tax=Halorubrum sp. N11 TaxID=3402276 RepID=UPI003EBE34DA
MERLTKKIGIHSLLASGYWAIQSRFHDNTATASVGDLEAVFTVSTIDEYYRFHNLVGEERIISDLLSEVRSDDVFYDIGANVGMYTCFVAQKLSEDQLVAFEPHPRNVSTLRENLELNGLDATVEECGLSNREAEGELAVSSDRSGEGRHSLAVSEDEETLPITLRRGDSMIQRDEIPPPTILKIDVEGAEVGVLEGLRTALQDSCRVCYVEVHPDRLSNYDSTMDDLQSLFEECGFDMETIGHRKDDEYFVKAVASE